MLDKSEVTKETPEKSLVEPRKRSGGRNAHGEITMLASRRRPQAAVPRGGFPPGEEGHSGARGGD